MTQFFDLTLGELLEENVHKYPDRESIVYSDRNLRYSYKEFNERVNNIAKGFLAMGVSKGDHIALWATNVPDWIAVFFASAKIGAIFVTVNTNYRSTELEYILKQSDSKILCIIDGYQDIDYIETTYEVVPELRTTPRGFMKSEKFPHLKHVVYLGPEKHRGMYNINEVTAIACTVEDSELEAISSSIDTHDVVNMQYTSGTTGFPKGVMLTHYNIINNGFYIGERQKLTPEDRLCLPVPLFHCFGMVLGIMAAFTHGMTICLLESFDPLKVLATVQKEKCTALYGVPTMFIAELRHPMFDMFDLSSLRTGIMAGSVCPEPVMREVIEKMYMREITNAYGLTEASPVFIQTATDDPFEARVATVGKPLPAIEVKIIDPETGETLGDDQPGELMCRGYNVMKGYYNMPEETAKAIEPDGWLHSGDIAVRRPDGYYVITGRLKDMIIRGGENIYPKELEDFLYGVPGVQDVQVVGVPSEKYGEEVAAYIQLKEGATLEPSDVQDFCRGKIARYKIPKYVFFIDSFPLTASGKIQKFILREDAAKRVQEIGK